MERNFGINLSLTIIGLVFIAIELIILSRQNDLLDVQNIKVQQQNELIESQRRSSYVILIGNVIESITNELNNPININRNVSRLLKGQIISLSNSLTPYKFIIGDSLTKNPTSPERGMLLLFIVESNMNNQDLAEILTKGNFQFSYIDNIFFDNDTLKNVDLSNSHINKLDVRSSMITEFYCVDCEINSIVYTDSKIDDQYFESKNNINNIRISSSQLSGFYYGFNNVNKVDISNSKIYSITFEANIVRDFYISNSRVESFNYNSLSNDKMLFDNVIINEFGINSLYGSFPSGDSLFIETSNTNIVGFNNSILMDVDLNSNIDLIKSVNSVLITDTFKISWTKNLGNWFLNPKKKHWPERTYVGKINKPNLWVLNTTIRSFSLVDVDKSNSSSKFKRYNELYVLSGYFGNRLDTLPILRKLDEEMKLIGKLAE